MIEKDGGAGVRMCQAEVLITGAYEATRPLRFLGLLCFDRSSCCCFPGQGFWKIVCEMIRGFYVCIFIVCIHNA